MRLSLWFMVAALNAGCVDRLAQSEPTSLDGQPVHRALPMTIERTQVAGLGESAYRILVPCTIDTRAGTCLFDTGAVGISINSCFAETTQRWDLETPVVSGSGTAHRLPNRKLRRLIVGNGLYEGVLAELSMRHDCKSTIGIVGRDIFKSKLFIDMDRSMLTNENPGVSLDQSLDVDRDMLLIPVMINGFRARALVDTGAATSLVDQAVLRRLAPGAIPLNQKTYQATDFLGRPVKVGDVTRAELSIAGHELDGVVVGAIDLGPLKAVTRQEFDLILGMNAIKELRWGFDLEHRRWGAAALKGRSAAPRP